MIQARLNLDTTVDNLAAETQQVMIAIDNLPVETEHIMICPGKPEELLPDTAKPLLLVAPRSDQAANNVAVSPFSNNFTTKLMDNDASLSNSDIHKVIDTGKKKSEGFFTLQMSPPTAAPSSQLSKPVANSKLLSGEIGTAPTSTSATPAQAVPQTLPQQPAQQAPSPTSPQGPLPSAAPTPPKPWLTIKAQLLATMHDGSAYTLVWLNSCKPIGGQYAAHDKEIGCTIFHLVDKAQLRYMDLMIGINPGMDKENVGHCINDYFGRPSQGNPLDT
jgi:hypothetical protein